MLISAFTPILGGCDRGVPPGLMPGSGLSDVDERTLVASKLLASAQSDALRAAFRVAGVEIPQLLVAYRRGEMEILVFPVDAGKAFAKWKSLHAVAERTGFYPVILHDHYAGFQYAMEDASEVPVEQTIAASESIDPVAWFRSHMDEVGKYDPDHVIPRNPGAVCEANHEPLILRDSLTRKPTANLFIMLLPTRHGYEVPAILHWGDFNACPRPEEHVAILRHWHERWGTELVAMTGATVELLAARRPHTGDESLAVAIEQYLYCPDIVEQGVDSVDALADSLAKSPMWFFWWD